jgi:Concanavalin A-like lectin/glucanases superfamily/Carboxypeptidase regulatory-like domain
VNFTVGVDDAFDLIVNRQSVVRFIGGTDFRNFVGTARNLPAGLVPIVLNYGEIGGEADIVLSASGGGLPGGVIPTEFFNPDPGTTVIGRVVDTNGAAIAGAMVRVGSDFSAETDGNGEFRITNVPTLSGNLTVTTTGVVDGQLMAGASLSLAPVLGGLTDAGRIVLSEPAGLLAWWRADNDAQDSAGSNHGMLLPVVDGAGFAEGKLGRAFSFDGTNDYVDLATEISGNPNFTLSAWIRPDAVWLRPPGQTAPGAVICTRDGLIQYDPNAGFGLFIFENRGGTIATLNYFARIRIEADQWSHVAFAATSTNTGRFFVNGVEIALGGAIPDRGVTSNYRTTIGANARPDLYELFKGRIDDVRVYNRTLGAAEIASIYRAASDAIDSTIFSGVVTLTNGNAVAGAIVSVLGLTNLSAVTGNDGRFTIANVPVAFGKEAESSSAGRMGFRQSRVARRTPEKSFCNLNPCGTKSRFQICRLAPVLEQCGRAHRAKFTYGRAEAWPGGPKRSSCAGTVRSGVNHST